MAIKILRVQFRDPVHIPGVATGGKQSLGIEDRCVITMKPDGVLITSEARAKTTVFVPHANIVSVAFEPEATVEKGEKK